jgi:hypothetical protein
MRPSHRPSAQLGGHLATWVRKHVKPVTWAVTTAAVISSAVVIVGAIVVAVVKLSNPSDPGQSVNGHREIRLSGLVFSGLAAT